MVPLDVLGTVAVTSDRFSNMFVQEGPGFLVLVGGLRINTRSSEAIYHSLRTCGTTRMLNLAVQSLAQPRVEVTDVRCLLAEARLLATRLASTRATFVWDPTNCGQCIFGCHDRLRQHAWKQNNRFRMQISRGRKKQEAGQMVVGWSSNTSLG